MAARTGRKIWPSHL